MLLNVGSGGGAAAAAPSGGATAGGAGEAAAEEKVEEKEEGKLSYATFGATFECDSNSSIANREGGVRRGHGFWSFRLDVRQDTDIQFAPCYLICCA